MPSADAGIEPEDEPLGGGAGDQLADTERAGTAGPGTTRGTAGPATAGTDDSATGPGSGDGTGSTGRGAPEIADDEDLAARLEVDPERGDVKG